MKLVGSVTLKTEAGDVVLASTKDMGAASPQIIQHSLHTLVGAMVNDLAVQPGVFKSLTVAVED